MKLGPVKENGLSLSLPNIAACPLYQSLYTIYQSVKHSVLSNQYTSIHQSITLTNIPVYRATQYCSLLNILVLYPINIPFFFYPIHWSDQYSGHTVPIIPVFLTQIPVCPICQSFYPIYCSTQFTSLSSQYSSSSLCIIMYFGVSGVVVSVCFLIYHQGSYYHNTYE